MSAVSMSDDRHHSIVEQFSKEGTLSVMQYW